MKLCVAQTHPVTGDIAANVARHRAFIELAADNGARMIVFPELSLTGYEPALAHALATHPDDARLDVFQQLADATPMTIGVGAPLHGESGIHIGAVIFEPHLPRRTYAKQYLHPDELPFFASGSRDAGIVDAHERIALAICYEISIPAHAEDASANGASLYVASVAKFSGGIDRSLTRLAEIARRHSLTVSMANSVGAADGQRCAGRSSVWNRDGVLLAQLNGADEGVIVFDTATQETTIRYLR